MDLISTIGESAALGAAGAIFWGDADYTKNRVGLGSVCPRGGGDGWEGHIPPEGDWWLQAGLSSPSGVLLSLGHCNVPLMPPFPQDSCQIIKNYLEEDLGRYIVNVTTAAQLCSTALCQGRGRCLRQDSTADVFLHLNSTSFQLRRRDGDNPQRPLFWAEGQLSPADTLFLRTHFRCHCYQGWQGSGCQVPADPRSDAPGPPAPLGFGVLLLLVSWR